MGANANKTTTTDSLHAYVIAQIYSSRIFPHLPIFSIANPSRLTVLLSSLGYNGRHTFICISQMQNALNS